MVEKVRWISVFDLAIIKLVLGYTLQHSIVYVAEFFISPGEEYRNSYPAVKICSLFIQRDSHQCC